MIVPRCPPTHLTSWPPRKGGAGGELLRRMWPAARALGIGLVLAVVAIFILASAHLIDRQIAMWVRAALFGFLVFLAIAETVLERLGLIDKPQGDSVRMAETPAARPPQPINQPAAAEDRRFAAAQIIGGELPDKLCGSGRRGNWRLEGDFDWKPHEDSAPR